jgi:23S rRNA (uridine2552-2'-O)-methyltransferase
MRVVDLGATPGGWSQVVAQKLAGQGKVIALDLLEMLPLAGVTFIQGDFREDAVLAELVKVLDGRPVDLVISDMAPNLSGVGLVDQARAMHLAELALEFALQHLKPGGTFLVKVFQGDGFDEYIRTMRGHFKQVATRKPKATERERSNSIRWRRKSCSRMAGRATSGISIT